MSYFMTIAGTPSVNVDVVNGVHFVPVSDTQSYLLNIAADIQGVDGGPLFLVDDGSGTSQDFVVEAENRLRYRETLEGTIMLALIGYCVKNGNSFRIWYADEADAYKSVVTCSSLAEICSIMMNQAMQEGAIRIRFSLNGNRQEAIKAKAAPTVPRRAHG